MSCDVTIKRNINSYVNEILQIKSEIFLEHPIYLYSNRKHGSFSAMAILPLSHKRLMISIKLVSLFYVAFRESSLGQSLL